MFCLISKQSNFKLTLHYKLRIIFSYNRKQDSKADALQPNIKIIEGEVVSDLDFGIHHV